MPRRTAKVVVAKSPDGGQRGRRMLDITDLSGLRNLRLPASAFGKLLSASELPGQITARVTEAVYGSPSGKDLLIPQRAKLICQYDGFAQIAPFLTD